MPKPCPYCGAHLRPLRSPSGGPPASYTHPGYHEGSRCWAAGYSIGAARIEAWDARSAPDGPRLAYEIENDAPRFNAEGRGEAATPEFLNAMIEYYQNRIRGLQQG